MAAIVCQPVVLPKRTNSLGYAASDCFACRTAQRPCDRRRPRCLACTSEGVVCTGFAQKLNWQRGIASRGKMSHRTFALPAAETAETAAPPADQPAQFSFVPEAGGSIRSRPTKSTKSTKSTQVRPATRQRRASPHARARVSSALVAVPVPLPRPPFLPLYPQTKQRGDMLNYYQVQFSPVMLTFHVHVNPWHMSLPMAFDVPCLMDGIVALSKRHRAHICQQAEDVDVLVLKDRALRSFRASLHTTDTAALLATVLTLVTLEYSRTSYAHWAVHIDGAHRIMEAAGGVDLARHNAPLRSFLVMILWYDLMTALVARRRPVFAKQYLVSVMAWRSAHEWSLVGLNGFPDEMFDLIHDIACASATAACGSVTVPHATAADLERHLWVAKMDAHSPSSASLFDCWRQAMLLYCARVFGTGAHNPFSREQTITETSGNPITSVAEGILAIVASMDPASSMQKQCLLPVVLAASELGSHSAAHRALRADVEAYCERWSRLAGLRMFLSALHFVRSVWVCRDHHADDDDIRPVWWGTVVEQAQRAEGRGSPALAQVPTKGWMFG